jgi:hypothetical protein
MTTEKLSKLHKQRPFLPFRIHFADRGHADVPHPEMLAYAPGGRTAVLYSPDERFQIVDLLLISRLEILNGRRHNQRQPRRR